jgi:hypothetical protein
LEFIGLCRPVAQQGLRCFRPMLSTVSPPVYIVLFVDLLPVHSMNSPIKAARPTCHSSKVRCTLVIKYLMLLIYGNLKPFKKKKKEKKGKGKKWESYIIGLYCNSDGLNRSNYRIYLSQAIWRTRHQLQGILILC